MRKIFKALAVTAVAASAAFFAGTALHAGDEDADSAKAAEDQKLADDALAKAVSRGNELFRSKDLGGKKTCASCHENAENPKLDLKTRVFSYPRYSRKAKAIVSMGQKINEMLAGKSGGAKAMDLAGADIIAIEAYIASLKKK